MLDVSPYQPVRWKTMARPVPEYLTCSNCGRRLVPLVEDRGRVAIPFHVPGGTGLIQTARILCDCGTLRVFCGPPLSGFRLGIVDEAGE